MKRKLLLRSIGCLAIVLCAVMVFGTTSSMATPLTEVKIGFDTPLGYGVKFDEPIDKWLNPYTHYTLKAKELLPDWGYAAFCVQAVYVNPRTGPWNDYYLAPIPVGGNWDVAVKMADKFFFNNVEGYTQGDYQLAIWDQLGVVTNGLIQDKSPNAFSLINNYNWTGYEISGKYALLASPSSQNFMTAVPEPGTILLLGAGLIGLVGFRRFRKK